MRRSLTLAAVAAGCALAAGCGQEPAPTPEAPRPVKTFTVSPGAGGTLEYPGQIRAVQEAQMAFEVPGRITQFPAREAQRVQQGEVLARLDPRDYEAQLDKARANLAKTRTDVARYEKLYGEGVSPLTELERYKRFFENAQADFKVAQKAVDDTILRAPFDGVVARKLVDDFANVQAKQPVLILQDLSTLRIDATIPERDFARMTPGLSLDERTARARPRVVVSSLPDLSFPARVTEFTTTADPTTRTYKATFDFEPPAQATVLPGMTAKVLIDLGGNGSQVILVPSQAVRTDPETGPFVWVIAPDSMQVSRAPVQIGTPTGSWVEVTGGLSPGQTLATSGVHELRDGMTVRSFER